MTHYVRQRINADLKKKLKTPHFSTSSNLQGSLSNVVGGQGVTPNVFAALIDGSKPLVLSWFWCTAVGP